MPMPTALQPLAARYRALPRKQQLAVMFGLPLAISGVFGWFTWQAMGQNGPDSNLPSILQRSGQEGNLWDQIEALRVQIAEQDAKAAKRQELAAKLKQLQEQTSEIESLLPRDQEKSEIREMIDSLAREIPPEFGAVTIKSVRINEAKEQGKSDYRNVIYQLEIIGELNGIISFIDSIEKPSARNPRFMSVNRITWKSGAVNEDPASGKAMEAPHSVQLDVVTYIYTPKVKAR